MPSKYSRSHINRIGEVLVNDHSSAEDLQSAISILDDWRALHRTPMKTLDASLRLHVSTVSTDWTVVQRLKRTCTIVDKLKHRQTSMKLGQMQDVGGLRVIVDNVAEVRELESRFIHSQIKHVLKRKYDYIADPKESGYRGIHLVYEYQNPRRLECDGLLVEIQLRTRLQHLWSTAVETAGFFLQKSFKSGQGNEHYLRFFQIISALFAFEEGQPVNAMYRQFTRAQLIESLHCINEETGFLSLLSTIQVVGSDVIPARPDADCWLIRTSVKPPDVWICPFDESAWSMARFLYTILAGTDESKLGNSQVVLVFADSVAKLKQGYPNYFLDIREFVETVVMLMYE